MSYEHFLHFKNTYLKFSSSSLSSSPTTRFDFTSFFGKISNFGTQNSKWIKAFSTGIIIYSSYYYFKHCKSMNYWNYCKSMNNCNDQFPFFSFFCRIKKLFSRNNSIENNKNNIALEIKEFPEHVKYDNGWFDELDKLKQSLTSTSVQIPAPTIFGDNPLLDPLREITPRGDIVMYYDVETKSFNYYSNSKNIPYSTLDAVARKYVCLHKDPSIYIDIRDEVQKGREKCLQQDKDNKLKMEKSKNKSESGILSSTKKSLFAAFKNYKTGRNVLKSLYNYNYNGKKETVVVMKDSINKFVYKGTIKQYDDDLKFYKNKQPSDSIDVSTSVDYTNNCNNCNNGCKDGCENTEKEIDYIKLNYEKQDISYAEFKKKYNQ